MGKRTKNWAKTLAVILHPIMNEKNDRKKQKTNGKKNFKHKKKQKKQKRWVERKRAIQMKYVWMLLLTSLNPWWARGPSDRHVNACYANCVCLGKSINKSWHQICKQRQANKAESEGSTTYLDGFLYGNCARILMIDLHMVRCEFAQHMEPIAESMLWGWRCKETRER